MSEREWRFYLDDMMGCVEKAMAYSHGFEQAEFEASGVNYDATLRNLELIGEAARHIPEPVRGVSIHSLAADHRYAEPVDPWLSRHRQRHIVEHHSG